MADEQPTGTPAELTGTQSGGSSSPAGGGSGDSADVAALQAQLEDERRKNAQLLSEKTRTEEMRRQLEAERQSSYRPAERPDVATMTVQELQQAASSPDPEIASVARNALQLAALQNQHNEARFRQLSDELEFARMSPDDRKLAEQEYATGNYRSPSVALDAARGKLLFAQQQKMAADRARAEEQARAREGDVVNVAPRPVTAAEATNRIMTHDEYLSKLGSLPRSEAADLKRKVDLGLVKIKSV